MPALNLESLDDGLMIDACPSFAGGQSSYGPPEQLQVTEARQLVNIDIRDGTATTRRGTAALGGPLEGGVQGLCWYDTPAREYLVAAANGKLWRWDDNSWTHFSSYAAANANGPITFAQLIDTVYIADGHSPLASWDGTTLTSLGAGSSVQPPIGGLLIAAQNRLWMAGTAEAPDGLYASRLIDGATWDAVNLMIRIGGGEGDPITGLAEWDDYQIVVFKRNSLYVVRADPSETHGADANHSLANATVTKLSDTVGCVAPRSIARVGSDLWFLADGGVFSVGRVMAQTQRELKPAASLPVQDLIDRINWSAAKLAAATFWNHRYLLSVPLDDETQPGSVLVYHGQRQAWCGLWTGWQAQCWAQSKAGGQERLDFGRADGGVRRWLDYVPAGNEVEATFQDAGVNFPSLIETRAMIFGEPMSRKSLLSLQTEFFGSRAMAKAAVRLDEDEPILLKGELSTDPGELKLNFDLPATLPGQGVKRRSFGGQHLRPFRSLQAVVSATGGKLGLRAAMASGFGNTLQLEE